jgi:hypothetical protein
MINIAETNDKYPEHLLNKNPQKTELKLIYGKNVFTQYNKFKLSEYYEDVMALRLNFDKDRYHAFSDFIIKSKGKLGGWQAIFMVNGLPRISFNSDMYAMFTKDSDNQTIDISSMICRTTEPFPIVSNEDQYSLSISFDKAVQFIVEFTAYVLSKNEHNTYTLCGREYRVYTYSEVEFKIRGGECKQPIALNIPIYEIGILINRAVGNEFKANLRHIPLIPKEYPTTSMLWNSCLDPLSSNTWFYPWGWHVEVKVESSINNNYDSDIEYTAKLLIRHPNLMQIGSGNGRMLFSMKPLNDMSLLSSNPMTKLSGNEFVEGYWFDSQITKDCAHQYGFDYDIDKIIYPWPKQESAPDREFIKMLRGLLPQFKTEHFFGGSPCRFDPNRMVGGEEYSFTFQDNKYKFPSGYLVYLEEYCVHPSPEFKEVIKSMYETDKMNNLDKLDKVDKMIILDKLDKLDKVDKMIILDNSGYLMYSV